MSQAEEAAIESKNDTERHMTTISSAKNRSFRERTWGNIVDMFEQQDVREFSLKLVEFIRQNETKSGHEKIRIVANIARETTDFLANYTLLLLAAAVGEAELRSEWRKSQSKIRDPKERTEASEAAHEQALEKLTDYMEEHQQYEMLHSAVGAMIKTELSPEAQLDGLTRMADECNCHAAVIATFIAGATELMHRLVDRGV